MMARFYRKSSMLKQLNRSLLVVIIASNSFLFLGPFWPKLTFEVQTRVTKPVTLNVKSEDSLANIDRSRNHLIIPRLQLDQPVLDGEAESTVGRGIWRLPHTATPGQNSNTILVGHRFTYTGPSVFYSLDKVQVNDDIVLVYDRKVYIFRVDSVQTVEPTEISIEAPTSKEKLTLYTCAPLGSVRYRLVINSHLEKTIATSEQDGQIVSER